MRFSWHRAPAGARRGGPAWAAGLLALGLAACAAPAVGAVPAAGGAPGAGAAQAFTDITAESGVAQVLRKKYEGEPKWWLSGLNLVDLDGDGRLDLFLSAHGGGAALALLGDGRGRFAPAPGEYPTTEIHLPYDINEDGRVDLQMTHGDGGGRWWLNESAPGRLKFAATALVAGRARQNAIIDLNRDGKADWLHEGPSGIVFESGDGTGGFKPSGGLDVEPVRNEINIHPVDLDGDGLMDLVVHWGRYEFTQGKSRIYMNDGKGGFRNATAEAGLREEGLAVKGVGDLNRDGRPDLMVLEDKRPEIYLNGGRGRFAKMAGALAGMEAATRPAYVSWGLAAVTDFDNDGIADILWNGRHFLWVLRGTGGGNFAYMNAAWSVEDKSAASVDDGLCFGDIDGDGRLDVVGYTGDLSLRRQVKVYRNDLPRQNWLRVRLAGAAGNRGAAGAKISVSLPERVDAAQKLLWHEQVMILASQSAHSYYSPARTERHYGLGALDACDVSVEFYPSGRRVERRGALAGTVVEVAEEGSSAP